jgi:DNA helicase II / ATP-dependent DNA helicase PcrA
MEQRLKKIILKKTSTDEPKKRIGYKINYEYELNAAQYEAVMHNNGAALVIAGAGTGKTRTLVYRVARLIEDGVYPESILLLTFTRKSSGEMLRRASILLDGRCEKVSGGTFHSFALITLRIHANLLGYEPTFNVLDQSDSEDTINLIRNKVRDKRFEIGDSNQKSQDRIQNSEFRIQKSIESSQYSTNQTNIEQPATDNGQRKDIPLNPPLIRGNSKRRFPKKSTLYNILSMSINKRISVEEIVKKDYPLYQDDIESIKYIFDEYDAYKRKYNLMDYDDLLQNLLELLKKNPDILKMVNDRYKYVMVDEYQDTNRLQHEIVLLLAGSKENVMAVGDDAQSIYAFRGADFQNIMFFPESFSDCKIYKIEENYRSTQPVLNLSNEVIKAAIYKYEKELYTRKPEGELPKIISAANERQQSLFCVQQILELREEGIELEDIAVLFRSGFLSFDLEIELNKANIPFKKFGGIKFMETAHIKDILAHLRIIFNPSDAISWQTVLLLIDGVGPRTASKIVDEVTGDWRKKSEDRSLKSDSDYQSESDLSKLNGQPATDNDLTQPLIPSRDGNLKSNIEHRTNIPLNPPLIRGNINNGNAGVKELIDLLRDLKNEKSSVGEKTNIIAQHYKPILKNKYDDWQKRWKDIEMFIMIAERYKSMREFLNDMAIEPPVESIAELTPESKEEEFLTLSTIHSAKGLEWKAVFLIWALEGRFPSAKSVDNLDSIEEERRLFYVACTRAKTHLYITYPINIFDLSSGFVLSEPSRFIRGIGEEIADRYVLTEEEE